MKKKYFFLALIGLLLIYAVAGIRSKYSLNECRKVKPEDLRSYIEKDFRSRLVFYTKPGGDLIGPFLDDSIKVEMPVLDEERKSGIDWSSTIAMKSEANGKIYRVMVYYTCGHGIEYSGAQKLED